MSNDYSVFRYADVLLMKAEALWRKSQSSTDAGALALVKTRSESVRTDRSDQSGWCTEF